MEVTIVKIEENGLGSLNNLVELAAYDLSELSGNDINENGLFVTNFDSRNWYEDDNSSHFCKIIVCVFINNFPPKNLCRDIPIELAYSPITCK